MTTTGIISCTQAISKDERVLIFRRTFPDMEEFADMYVDAYVVISERYVVICDTLLCPDDMQTVMEHLRPELTTGRQLLVIIVTPTGITPGAIVTLPEATMHHCSHSNIAEYGYNLKRHGRNCLHTRSAALFFTMLCSRLQRLHLLMD